jgi:hypothetical protein
MCFDQMGSVTGTDPAVSAKFLTPGLSGAQLKAHIDTAIDFVFPELGAVKATVLDLKSIHGKLPTIHVYLRPLGAVITQLLCDPSVAGPNSENLDLKQALEGALSGSSFVIDMQGGAGPDQDLVAVNFYHDAALVDAGRRHSLIPLSVFLSQLSAGISMSKSGSLLLG